MQLFQSKEPPKNEFLSRYLAAATRFQNVGIVVVISSVLMNFLGGQALKLPSIFLFMVGALALVFGGSSLRPHNVIKSFAQQCSREPNDTIADGLLEAIERNKTTALTKNSIRTIYLAIEIYAALPDADQELVNRLTDAAKTRLTQKKF